MSDPANDSTTPTNHEAPPMSEFEAQVARDRAFAIAQNARRGIAAPAKPVADRRNSMPVRADMTRPGAQARGVVAHVNMTHSAGARVVQGPANKHGMPVGQGANTTVRVVEGVPDRTTRAPVRPNVAPRPGTGGAQQHGPSVRVMQGQPSPARPQQLGAKPFVRGQASNVVTAVAPPAAAPVTPLSTDQMLFLTHLCDAFLAQAKAEPGAVEPRYVAFATETREMIAQWMTEIHAGGATSTGTAVAPSAAPIVAPVAPVTPAVVPEAPATAPTAATEK